LSGNLTKTRECIVFWDLSADAGEENNTKLADEDIEKP